MKPLHVIQLGKYYPPATGGIETHTQTLCQGLSRLGHRVQVLVVNHQDDAGRDVTFEKLGKTSNKLDFDGSIPIHRIGRWGNLVKLDVATNLLGKLQELQKQKPDLWHLHTPNITMMLGVLACPGIRPLVITHHSDIIKQRFLKHFVRPLEQGVYRRATRIFSTSPPYIDGSELLQLHRERVESLPLGLDLRVFREPSPESRVAEAKFKTAITGPVWLCVGRLVYYKALEVAIQALKQLPGELWIIGTGPMQQAWQQLAREVGVEQRVRWLGRVNEAELTACYRLAQAYWFPSNARSEGFGLVQVEAMASGCPVINTNIPGSGVSWVSQHEQTGFTIPVNDVAALVQASRRLLDEYGLRQRFSAEAVRQAEARFSSNVMAELADAFYREVVRS